MSYTAGGFAVAVGAEGVLLAGEEGGHNSLLLFGSEHNKYYERIGKTSILDPSRIYSFIIIFINSTSFLIKFWE